MESTTRGLLQAIILRTPRTQRLDVANRVESSRFEAIEADIELIAKAVAAIGLTELPDHRSGKCEREQCQSGPT